MPDGDAGPPRRGLVVIGAPKSGTTAIYDYLASSHLFATATLKETRHFQSPEHPLARRRGTPYEAGLGQYADLFAEFPARPLLEASPDYYYDVGARSALIRLQGEMEQLTCLCLVREPVARLRSMFLFARDTIGTVAPGATLDAYGEDVLEGRLDRWSATPLVRDALQVGLYGALLKPWTQAFGHALVVVPQEWASSHPQRLATALGDSVGLGDHDWPARMPRANATVAPASRVVHRVVRGLARRWPEESTLRRRARTAYDAVNARVGSDGAGDPEDWSPALRARLEAFYSDDVEVLRPQISPLVAPSEMPPWLTGRHDRTASS